MLTAPVITAGINAVVLALTPTQRWEAAGRFSTNIITDRWFILIASATLITFTVLLIILSYQQMLQRQKVSWGLFAEYADKAGLSSQERQILLNIANHAGLRQKEAIFTMSSAFDRGVAKMVEQVTSGARGGERSRELNGVIPFLREKLGFKKQPSSSIGSSRKSRKLSSRQIPVGKKVHITRRKHRGGDGIESTVIENNDIELSVELSMPVESAVGEGWCARYYFGSSVWEFDTSVVSCHDNILVLNHAENVRFINRRRFLRVGVRRPAFIAQFPFKRNIVLKYGSNQREEVDEGLVKEKELAMVVVPSWGPPEFMQATITELGGPGLRINIPFEVKTGERIVVIFRLDEEQENASELSDGEVRTEKARIIQDIGEVRHVKALANGFSIAVELTGLSDSDVDELVRATNAAAVQVKARKKEGTDSAEKKTVMVNNSVGRGV